jgi:RNA polymerase sigma-70 factor (ECF subfamily)
VGKNDRRGPENDTVTGDDASLVRRCLRGDEEGIRQLVGRFQGDVYGLCVRLLGHRQDAEDVAQEVFLRIFRSLQGWDDSRPLKPWIMGIAVNRCRTWMSQRSRRPELVDYLHDTLAGQPDDDSAELLGEIRIALSELRLEYRTVFVLFHEQGQPYELIAQSLDRPVGTIKTWLHRARLEILDRLRRRGMVSDEDTSATSGTAQKNVGKSEPCED